MTILEFLTSINLQNALVGLFTILIIGIFIILYFAAKDKRNCFDWTDLVIDPITNKASLTKFLQLLGGITGTFTILWYSIKVALDTEMLAVYLASLGVSEGFSRWVSLKYNQQPQSTVTTTIESTEVTIPEDTTTKN